MLKDLGKTQNSELFKNSSGRVRVAKLKFGSGRVAGTRQGLVIGLVWVQWVAPAGLLCTFVQPSFFQASYSFHSDIPEREIEDSF